MANKVRTKEIKDANVRIGKMLQEARESKKVLQADMTEYCGLTKNHISAIERGVSQASLKMLLGYCEKLNMTPNEILGFHENFVEEQLNPVLRKMSQKDQEKIVAIAKILAR